MELDLVREELNNYDYIIRNMITLRMSLIPIVADIKIKNDLPLFQGKREDEIYKNIEIFAKQSGVDENLVKDIYKLIIANALKIEECIVKDSKSSVINKQIDFSVLESVKENFEKLNNILRNEIPNIISNIKQIGSENGLNLNEIATLYYDEKVNKEN